MSVAARTIRASVMTGSASQLAALASLATSIAIARILAPEEVGRYALVATIVALATQAASTQMSGFYIVSRETPPSLLGSCIALELIGGLVVYSVTGAIGAAYAGVTSDWSFAALLLVAGTVLITNPAVVFASVWNRDLRFGRTAAVQVAAIVLGCSVKVGLAASGAGVWALVLGDVVVSVVTAVAYLALVRDHWAFGLDRALLRGQLSFGLPSLGTGLLSVASIRAQDLVVAACLGTRALGLFYIATRISTQIYQLGRSLSLALLPAFSRTDDAQLARAYAQVTRYSALLMVLPSALLLTLARPFVEVVFGSAWRAAALPVAILMAAAAIRFVLWHVGNLLKSRGRVREMMVLTAVQLVLVTAGSIAGALVAGLVGVAAAVLLVEILLAVPKLRLIQSVIPFQLAAILGWPVLAGVAAAISAGGARLAFNGPAAATLVVALCAGCAGFALVAVYAERRSLQFVTASLRRPARV
jgi:O-antigen/teichoic acid export membrane protein